MSSTLSAATRGEIERFVTKWLSDQRIPGAAVAVVDGDETVYAEGFGARDLESNTPATADTLFGVGSCTKSFTAAAVMQLAEDDGLALDDAVSEYVPHLEGAPGDPVTVAQLLSHTSGVPSDGSAGPLITRPLGQGHVEVPLSSDDDFRRHVEGSLDRRVTDRETFFYYNSGYTILGRLVEAVSGESFTEYVTDHLLSPLGMDRSTFDAETFESETDRMTPYLKADGDSVTSQFPFDDHIAAPGGLVSSAREMAGYLQLYLQDGTVGGARLLSPESVERMTDPVGEYGTYVDGRSVTYGFGLMLEDYLGDRLVGHGGSVAVSNAYFGYLEDAELGVTVVCTTGPEAHPSSVGKGVLAVLRGEEPAAVQPHFRLMDALETVTGEYAAYRDVLTATVERVGGSLRVAFESGLGGEELVATVERVEDDSLVCTTTESGGFQRPVLFEFDGDSVDLFYERNRLQKTR